MRPLRIQANLERAEIDGFSWPLGVVPRSVSRRPVDGYLVGYEPGTDDEPDTYTFRVVVSHDQLAGIARRAFELLPEYVHGIMEIGSRDAYRTVDTYLGREPVSRSTFLQTWRDFEPILLEEASIGVGANAEEPHIEVFVDQLKTISIYVPVDLRDEVEELLQQAGLGEIDASESAAESEVEIRPVLELVDEYSPDLDELLLELRDAWQLELNVDPDRNLDEGGRELGYTLWNVVAIVSGDDLADEIRAGTDPEAGHEHGAYAIFWLTAPSLHEAQTLVEQALRGTAWRLEDFYSTDRVAYDERPDELSELAFRRDRSEVHLMYFDPWDQHERSTQVDQDNAT